MGGKVKWFLSTVGLKLHFRNICSVEKIQVMYVLQVCVKVRQVLSVYLRGFSLKSR